MNLLKEIQEKAKNKSGIIVLPEANIDERVMEAAKIILKNNYSKIVVFGETKEFPNELKNNENCQIIDINKAENLSQFAEQLYLLRKEKGMTIETATELVNRPIYYAMMMLKNELADGVVAGAKYSTADTLRPALQIVKTKKGKSLVTGCMLMLKEDFRPLVFGDVSLVENPTSEKLSDIAVDTAEFMDKSLGIEPRVALLSYSTKGSATSEMTEKVKTATNLAQAKSSYYIDGEMQMDSALNSDIAKKKGVSDTVGGRANVLIFPDLNAGNIGYKIATQLGGFLAVGPIMLNFNKPVNDLSRGCTVEEIINTVCITKLMI